MNDDAPEYTPSERVRAYAWTYLTEWHPEPVGVDTMRDLDRHSDDLPTDWQQPPWQDRGYMEGGNYRSRPLTTRGRADQFLNDAQLHIRTALTLCGFTQDDASNFGVYNSTLRRIETLARDLWEYRRYGIRPEPAAGWLDHDIPPPRARVYTDAGVAPASAENLETYAARIQSRLTNPDPQVTARLILMCLDYRVARPRAATYVAAGIAHHEVPEWEKQRKQGEPVDDALTFLAVLNHPRFTP